MRKLQRTVFLKYLAKVGVVSSRLRAFFPFLVSLTGHYFRTRPVISHLGWYLAKQKDYRDQNYIIIFTPFDVRFTGQTILQNKAVYDKNLRSLF